MLRRWKDHKYLIELEMTVSSQIGSMVLLSKLQEMVDVIEKQCHTQNEFTEESEREQIGELSTRTLFSS